ncbi:hypothetical protein B0H17DRAFT_1213624 [Mycena rosella]|uniref:Uncharacterized protein n=1 Tax=Mycena rosella TaxID=1033263 RepID=A0AAD7CPR6_MYCRO|nr:hypothetical protein B0H17DRAFT_1213624 [Mycena rosella]
MIPAGESVQKKREQRARRTGAAHPARHGGVKRAGHVSCRGSSSSTRPSRNSSSKELGAAAGEREIVSLRAGRNPTRDDERGQAAQAYLPQGISAYLPSSANAQPTRCPRARSSPEPTWGSFRGAESVSTLSIPESISTVSTGSPAMPLADEEFITPRALPSIRRRHHRTRSTRGPIPCRCPPRTASSSQPVPTFLPDGPSTLKEKMHVGYPHA